MLPKVNTLLSILLNSSNFLCSYFKNFSLNRNLVNNKFEFDNNSNKITNKININHKNLDLGSVDRSKISHLR